MDRVLPNGGGDLVTRETLHLISALSIMLSLMHVTGFVTHRQPTHLPPATSNPQLFHPISPCWKSICLTKKKWGWDIGSAHVRDYSTSAYGSNHSLDNGGKIPIDCGGIQVAFVCLTVGNLFVSQVQLFAAFWELLPSSRPNCLSSSQLIVHVDQPFIAEWSPRFTESNDLVSSKYYKKISLDRTILSLIYGPETGGMLCLAVCRSKFGFSYQEIRSYGQGEAGELGGGGTTRVSLVETLTNRDCVILYLSKFFYNTVK